MAGFLGLGFLNWRSGTTAPAPVPPDGFVFITDSDGVLLTDAAGNYLVQEKYNG